MGNVIKFLLQQFTVIRDAIREILRGLFDYQCPHCGSHSAELKWASPGYLAVHGRYLAMDFQCTNCGKGWTRAVVARPIS